MNNTMEGDGPGAAPPGRSRPQFPDRIRHFSLRAYLGVMSVLAVVVRLLPWRASISPNHVLFIQPDAYYHLRRATIMVRNFPLYPTIDSYMAYPQGAEPPWPPLYDFLIALISIAVGLGNPSDRTIMLVTAFLPPLLAGLTVVPAFLLARELFGRRVALVAAFFAVLMPGQLTYSVVGSGDHHVAEVLFSTLFFYFLMKSLRLYGVLEPPAEGEVPPGTAPAPSPRAARRAAAWAGVSLGVATLIWQGSLVFAAIGAGFLALRTVLDPEREHGRKLLEAGAVSLLLAALLAGAGRAAIPPATEQTVFGFGFFSWFQPAFLALLACLLLAFGIALDRIRRAGWEGRRLATPVGLFLIASAGIFLAVPGLRNNIADALVFLTRRHPYLASINEFQPLIDRNPLQGGLTLPVLYGLLYLSGFLIPLFLCVRLSLAARKRALAGRELFFLVWTVAFGGLTLLQKRWGNVYSMNMAAGIGVFVVDFLDRTRIGQRYIAEFEEWRRETGKTGAGPGLIWKIVFYSRRYPRLYTVLAATLFFIPYYSLVYGLAFPIEPVMNPDAYNSFLWIRLNTPPTRNPWKPVEKPEYSILAPWDLGHYLQYISERPTVANNFGYQLRGGGLEDSVRFLLAGKEEDLLAICERRDTRYLVLTDVFGGLDSMGPIIGIDFVRDFTEEATAPNHPGGGLRAPNGRFYALASQRMYVFDGSATPETEAITRFRLVFESKGGPGSPFLPPDIKYFKLFERVRGARITGKGTPGLPVTVSVRMMTNFDRFFDYVTLAQVGTDGTFRAIVPYASDGTGYPVRAVSPYLAMTEKEAVFFTVGEKDVTEGREIRINLKGKGMAATDHPKVGGPPPIRP